MSYMRLYHVCIHKENANMEMQRKPGVVVMESLFGEDPPLTFCPACGKQVIVEIDGQRDVDPCPHLVFMYMNEIECFASDDFSKRIEHEDTDVSDYDGLIEYMCKLGYDDSMLVVEAVGSGLACGPSSISEFVGFNFKAL